jgi:uncharacterized membrane protein YoaK (UPF0700 family)
VATAFAVSRASTGRALAWVLGLECVLLTLMMTLMLELPLTSEDAAPVIAAALTGIAAMGVQSAMVRMFMRGAPSTNVMTTNTSQLAIDLTILLLSAAGLTAAGQAAESRDRFAHYWPPVAGFVSGTALGALGEHIAGNFSLAGPVLVAYALLGWSLLSPSTSSN